MYIERFCRITYAQHHKQSASIRPARNLYIRHNNLRNHLKEDCIKRMSFPLCQRNPKRVSNSSIEKRSFSKLSICQSNELLVKAKPYFHDGSIINIEHFNKLMRISMETAEIDNEERKKIRARLLSSDNRLKGILNLKNIRKICVDEKLVNGQLRMIADSATILDFNITAQKVYLFIKWRNFLPKPKIELYSEIKITFDEFWCLNVPDMYDPFR